jgi:hypothetical protein
MAFLEVPRSFAVASALGLSLAAAGHAQSVVRATEERTVSAQARTEANTIRPFQFRAPEAALVELRRRIQATQWPEKETVNGDSQGVPLATMQQLARYWATDYDWRKVEARLNALPQFVTRIDGLDIHFIHVRSRHPQALPIVISHGTRSMW